MNIKDLRENSVLQQKNIEVVLHTGDTVLVVNKKPLTDQIKIIDQVINACAEREKFFNIVKMELMIKLLIVKEYTNIEFNEEDLQGFGAYKAYDVLSWGGVFDAVLPLVEDYQNIYNWCHNSCENISNFWKTFLGSLVGISEAEKEQELIGKFKDLIDQLKGNPDLQQQLQLLKK